MVQKKQRRGRMSKARRSSSAKAGGFKLPKAFRIVPIRMKARAKRGVRLLGAEDLDSCPLPYHSSGRVKIGGQWYCVCVADGLETLMVACPSTS